MSDALASQAHILVVAGVLNLVFSFALGWVLGAKRAKEPITALHWLQTAHVVSLQEGMMLLGLAYALQWAVLSSAWATAGVWLLVAGSVLQDLSGFVNWLRGTGDQFAEKSAGWVLASINAVLNTAGLAIVTFGVLQGSFESGAL